MDIWKELQDEGVDAGRFIVWYRHQFLAGLGAPASPCVEDSDASY